jgi:hypothetical protein
MTKKQAWSLSIGIALGIALLGGGFIWLVFFMTRGPVEAADTFLAQLGEGKIQQAYAGTTSGYRQTTPEERFSAAVRRWKLTDYRAASWHNREVHNNTGAVEGMVTTRDGKVIPLKMSFLKEEGAWRLCSLQLGQGVELPEADEVRALVQQTLLDFNRAVQDRDFQRFHDGIAALWKREISPQGLQQVFQTFVDNRIDIAAITAEVPVFEGPPQKNGEGRLVLAGHYPTRPSRVFFHLEYVYELPAWKLTGIQVRVKE